MRVNRKSPIDPYDNSFDALARAIRQLSEDLDLLFDAINSVDLRSPQNAKVPANVDGRYLIYTSNGVADTDDTLNHQLGRKPEGFIQIEVPVQPGSTPAAGQVYYGSVASTDSQITLRCTTASRRCVILLF